MLLKHLGLMLELTLEEGIWRWIRLLGKYRLPASNSPNWLASGFETSSLTSSLYLLGRTDLESTFTRFNSTIKERTLMSLARPVSAVDRFEVFSTGKALLRSPELIPFVLLQSSPTLVAISRGPLLPKSTRLGYR